MYETVVRPLLFRLDPERAHNLAVRTCQLAGRVPLARRAAQAEDERSQPSGRRARRVRKVPLGASLMLLYTGLGYRGPGVVKEILRALVELVERDGFVTTADAVGGDARA